MNFGISNLTNYAKSYINQQNRTVGRNSSVDFNSILSSKKAENIEAAAAGKVEEYTKYLQSKYGNVAIQNIGKDQASLDRIGKSMNGSDVIIAPNILEQMANDPKKATYYEKKIDDFFCAIPSLNASFASKGLTYEPGGVVIHKDGSVTYVGGCMNDPQKAKYLEENLVAIPDCVSSAISGCQGTLTNLSYNVDANGNISVAISGTSDPDGKIARENAERKEKEKKAAEEKTAERRAEKKAAEEKAAKKCAEKAQIEESMEEVKTDRISISATGNSMESVTKSIISALTANTGTDVARFDVKA